MSHEQPLRDAADALTELREGHERYLSGKSRVTSARVHTQVRANAGGQRPFAVILACADSRVPPEIVFDQDVGDLFVLRVAGNVADAFMLGSIQYAIQHLGSRLIVVLGHERCGAVKAALEVIANRERYSGPLGQLVSAIVPRVAPVYRGGKLFQMEDAEAVLDQAVRVNVRRQTALIRDALEHLGQEEITLALWLQHIQVVGSRYDLDTGEVEFFDVPDPARRKRIGLLAAGDRPVAVQADGRLSAHAGQNLEVFEMYDDGEDRFALRTLAGPFLRVRRTGVVADGSEPELRSGLGLVDLGDYHFALRTANEGYLSLRRDGHLSTARQLSESGRFRIVEIDD